MKGVNAHEQDHNLASSVTITSLFMLVFIIFNVRLEKGQQKTSKCKKNAKGGGVDPKVYIYLNSIFCRIDKKSQNDFKKFTFWGGGGPGQFGKSLHFEFSWTLHLLSSGTQNALLDMKLNFHLIKNQNQTFFD